MPQTILITGCSSGFGRLAAEKFARQGDRVFATMRGITGKNAAAADELRALAKSDGLDLSVLELEVSSTKSVNAAAKEIEARDATPDVVINNAGQMFVGVTEAFTAEELTHQLDINIVGVHRMNRAFLPSMRSRGSGLCINISSIAGRFSIPFFGAYHASKWGLEGYSQAVRAELASSGVDVVVVEPGPFTTALFPSSTAPTDADGCAKTYPPVVNQTFEEMGKGFDDLFADAETPTDPTLVVDRLVELAAMSPGTRPFRSVVGVDFGVTQLNTICEPQDAAVLGALELTKFATLSVPGVQPAS